MNLCRNGTTPSLLGEKPECRPTHYSRRLPLVTRTNIDRRVSIHEPSREDWEENLVIENGDKSKNMDGSKTRAYTGASVYSEMLRIQKSFKLMDKRSVLQAEI